MPFSSLTFKALIKLLAKRRAADRGSIVVPACLVRLFDFGLHACVVVVRPLYCLLGSSIRFGLHP